MVRISLLLALAVSALVSASPVNESAIEYLPGILPNVTVAGPEAFSYGFRLYAHAVDRSSDLASNVHGTYLNAYHIGAGINMGVLHAADEKHRGSVFYLNQRPGHKASIMTDSGEFPYVLTVPPKAAPGEKHVLISVGHEGTPASVSGKVVQIGDNNHGTFMVCRRTMPYFRVPVMSLQYSYGQGPISHGCVPIQLGLKCAALPMSQVPHQHAQKVPCYARAAILDGNY